MAMNSVLTNTAASSAQRFLTDASGKASSSISKMSSGSRIVKASDDAASLAISNKLRADIATLNQAGRNASQGASMLQVASGGLSQIGDILTRMKTLSTQVVNGTLSTSERQFAQQEFGQLITQVGETAAQTQVNGIAVLNGGDKGVAEANSVTVAGAAIGSAVSLAGDGTWDGTYVGIATTSIDPADINGLVEGLVKDVRVADAAGNGTDVIEIDIGEQTFKGYVSANAQQGDEISFVSTSNDHNSFVISLGVAAYDGNGTALQTDLKDLFNLAGREPTAGASTFVAAKNTTAGTAAELNGGTLATSIKASGTTENGTYSLTSSTSGTGAAEKVTFRLQNVDTGDVYETVVNDESATNNEVIAAGTTKTVKFGNGLEVTLGATQLNGMANATNLGSTGNEVVFGVTAGTATTLDFQIGADSRDTISVTFDSMTTGSLGISSLNIETVSNAQNASAAIDTAINRVNAATAQVGALQSRMEYVQSNLATVTENLEAANGIFKDVDMAKEMTEFTKQQTLMQAGVSMLSQANQMPQMLMRLLG